MKYTVYILNCSDNTYYTGVTNNIERRLQEHLTNEGENSYTFQRRPLHLVFQLDFLDVNQAIEFEKQVKGWRREKKEALIKGDWDILKGLAECLNETSHRNFLESRLSSTPLRLTLAQEQKVEQKQDPGQKEDQKRVPEKEQGQRQKRDTKIIILPSSYLGNVEYFYHLLKNPSVLIDIHEPFQKQTYRSRCEIMTANGRMNLSVPVERPDGSNTVFKNVRISYQEHWQKDHLRSIESAYRKTPYYEYYIDQITAVFQKKHELLWQLNQELCNFMIDKMGLSAECEYSTEPSVLIENDFRATLNPKNNTGFRAHRYIQPFEETQGFQSNLSSLDLLFNEGPNSISILQESTFEPID